MALSPVVICMFCMQTMARPDLDFGPFNYVANDKTIREIGYELSLAVSAEVRFEGDIEQSRPITGSWKAKRFSLVLDGVADTANFDWLVVDDALVLSSRHERSTISGEFSGSLAERRLVKKFLQNTGNEKAFVTTFEDKMVTITGPAWFIGFEAIDLLDELQRDSESIDVSDTATSIRFDRFALSNDSVDEVGVMTFKLKYAWVDDKTFNIGAQTTLVPGIASLVNSLLQGGTPPSTFVPTEGAELDELDEGGEEGGDVVDPTGLNSDGFVPTIFGDIRTNSLVVRDHLSKRLGYEALIDALDQPSALVQLEAYIVDINRTKLREIGISFESQSGSGQVQVNPGAVSSDGGGTATNNNNGFAANLVLSKLVGNQLLANIRALETTGDSQIVSVPSVLAMNNIEAAISRRETFYIAINSERDAELAPVVAETRLLVTPSVIEAQKSKNKGETSSKIKLLINIQDATIDGVAGFGGSNTPRTREFQVSTQAVVAHGDLILVGGQIINQKLTTEDKTPLLGDIPLIGRLFRSERSDDQQFIRVFMVKPTVIAADLEH